MKWSAQQVAGFALGAGFGGGQAVRATSVALVSSGGDDLFRWHGPVPGSGDYRGLFAIDVDTYPETRVLDLTNPRVNAAAAYTLTDRLDAFSWSPWFANGVWRWAEAVAVDAVKNPQLAPTVDNVVARFDGPAAAARTDHQLRALDASVDSLRNVRRS